MATISGTLRLNDAFSNVLNRFNSGIQRSVAASNRLKSSLNSGSNGMTALGNSANKANVGLRQIIAGSAFGSMISNAASAASNGVRAFVGELNESTVAWSTFEGNMKQMGKSPAEINAAKKSLQKFAQDTIYSSSDMASTYSQLAAVGTKNTTQLVKGFGGLAAAATDPKQAMKTLSQQATQMAAKPTVQWQDFKLMLEQTPAGMAAVAKSMGMSTRQLVKQVQDGTIKTNQFLNAIAKTGTNANFSKMATQYKTVGQALDGLKETLANKVQPQFKKLSDIIIKGISKFTDKLGKVNFKKFADKLIDDINRVKKGISNFTKGFTSEFGMTQFKQTAHDISESFKTLFEGLSKGSGKNPLADLGKGVGRFALQMANGLSNLATAISQMDPSSIKALAAAFLALKFGVNGLKLVAIAAGLKIISKLDPGQLQHLATAITALATAFVVFKVASAAFKAVSGIAGFFNGIKSGIASVINLVTVTLPAAFSGIGDVIAVALGPVGLIIAGITVLIVGAINAWQNNFLSFRDNIQNLFSNLGEVLDPLKAAFNGLGEALEPASGALSVFGNIISGISIGAIYGIAVALAFVADKVSHLISRLTAGVYVIRAFIDSLGTVGNAAKDVFTGNWSFSNTKNAAHSVTKDIEGISEALSHLGDNTVTDKTIAALQGIDL
ncbi:MAG: tape measure protein, partial [Lactobacillus sp.]|nr:tape measure protein [Lactobacillus sp.]